MSGESRRPLVAGNWKMNGVRASVALGPVMHFVSPAAGGGLVFAVGGRKLQAVR